MIKLSVSEIHARLKDVGLKVTPQRMAILEAVHALNNHPSAEQIMEYIREVHPGIAVGTVYKTLETLVQNNIIRKVKTEKDIMRYDGIIEQHHHLYCATCDLIEDFRDPNLDEMLQQYFNDKPFKGFEISEIKLQIKGTFNKC